MFNRIFIAHPARAGETYWGHARYAAGVSLQLFGAAFAALAHAAVPALFETTASRTVIRLYPAMCGRARAGAHHGVQPDHVVAPAE